MKAFVLLIGISLTSVIAIPTSAQDDLEQRREVLQANLNRAMRNRFPFKDEEANVLYSLSQFQGKCQVHMITNPTKRGTLTFKFVRDGIERVAVQGHSGSVFRADEHTLFFAQFSPADCGCVVAAYDLDNGREIWRTELQAVGQVPHAAYSNKVNMYYWHKAGREEEEISITGHESYGDYVEWLDRKTGKQLAHRVYRKGWEKTGK
jgi:hypothetical protein